jgi:protein ImuA
MSDAAEKVAVIRGSLAGAVLLEKHVRVPLGHDAADACLKGGLRRGALHEVFAQGGHEAAATCFAAALAGRVGGRKHLLWIRQDFSALEFGELAGTGLLELGIDPGRVLLLRVDDATAALRAGIDALSCAGLGAVVIEIPGAPKVLDLTASRRLTLSSSQSNVTAILLRFLQNLMPARPKPAGLSAVRSLPKKRIGANPFSKRISCAIEAGRRDIG